MGGKQGFSLSAFGANPHTYRLKGSRGLRGKGLEVEVALPARQQLDVALAK